MIIKEGFQIKFILNLFNIFEIINIMNTPSSVYCISYQTIYKQ